ncbi:FG-GAP-like repeat-containing protein [Streptomyces acidiscabies]|uniref:FG-GAP-like repeat-containing protein n=1 Tax=Streptomyces acidiscabies TaxID=42234 RepID=UPI0038F7C70B
MPFSASGGRYGSSTSRGDKSSCAEHPCPTLFELEQDEGCCGDLCEQWDLPNAPRRAGALIDQILTDAPETVVIFASVIPASKPGMQPRIDAFNASLPGLVKERQDRGKHVLLAPMCMVPVSEVDGAHPNDAGYRKMAEVFGNAIWRAHYLGWIKEPVPGNGQECPAEDESGSKAGPGWRALGVVAPGMDSPEGRTDLADLNGDQRADYVRIPDEGPLRIALNTQDRPGKPHWVEVDADITTEDAERVRFADVSGDRRADYLMVGGDGSVHAYINNGLEGTGPGGRRFTEHLDFVRATGYPGDKSAFRDISGGGKADYVVVYDGGSVRAWLNRGGNT